MYLCFNLTQTKIKTTSGVTYVMLATVWFPWFVCKKNLSFCLCLNGPLFQYGFNLEVWSPLHTDTIIIIMASLQWTRRTRKNCQNNNKTHIHTETYTYTTTTTTTTRCGGNCFVNQCNRIQTVHDAEQAHARQDKLTAYISLNKQQTNTRDTPQARAT